MGGLFEKVMLRLYKRPEGTGRLTEDFEHGGSISNPSGASGDLAVENELVRGLNRGDGQGEVLSDSDPPSQRGAVIAFPLATLGAESHALPGSLLLLNEQKDRRRYRKREKEKKDKEIDLSKRKQGT